MQNLEKTIKPNLISINNDKWSMDYTPILNVGLIDYHRLPGTPLNSTVIDNISQLIEDGRNLSFRQFNTEEIRQISSQVNRLLRVGFKLRSKRAAVSSYVVDQAKFEDMIEEMKELTDLKVDLHMYRSINKG